MTVKAVIPARGGSKGIPQKNIQDVAGHPLIAYVIDAALKSETLDEVWVSTDCPDIADISESYGAGVIERPAEISGDKDSSELALAHACEALGDFDILVFLQATSPLTLPEDIDEAVELVASEQFDSALSVCADHGGWLCGGFHWSRANSESIGVPQYEIANRQMRQDIPPMYRENGAIYVTRPSSVMYSGCRISGNVGLHVMPRQRSFEVDYPEDLTELAAFLGGPK